MSATKGVGVGKRGVGHKMVKVDDKDGGRGVRKMLTIANKGREGGSGQCQQLEKNYIFLSKKIEENVLFAEEKRMIFSYFFQLRKLHMPIVNHRALVSFGYVTPGAAPFGQFTYQLV